MTSENKRLIILAALAAFAGLTGSIAMIGQGARIVHVIGIFAAGFASGGTLVRALCIINLSKKDQKTE